MMISNEQEEGEVAFKGTPRIRSRCHNSVGRKSISKYVLIVVEHGRVIWNINDGTEAIINHMRIIFRLFYGERKLCAQ